jgi:predicted MFS family arabinose efflux permease
MPPQAANPVGKLFGLLRRRNVAIAMAGVMLTFAGAFSTFTYLRPFLETYTRVSVPQLSLLLLALGLAGFVGTHTASTMVGRYLYVLLAGLPLALGVITVGLLGVRYHISGVAVVMFAWGAVNSAIPVCWATWLSKGISDEPESGGGLMVGAIQLSIMLGAAFGGLLLDHISVAATLIGGTILLVLASLTIGGGKRIQARVLNADTDGRSELAGVPRFRGLSGRAG